MNSKPCKICGGTHFKKLGALCSNMKIMGPQFSGGSCDIVVCSDCGFVFNQYENADQSCFDSYYRSSSSKTMNYYEMYPKETADNYFLHIYNEIRGHITQDSKILDIAGGYGELAQLLVKKGVQNVTVLEWKPECVQAIRNANISAIEDNLLQLQTNQERYDLVICSHTLEHFIDVDIALKKLKELVKADGYVYLEVPDLCCYSELERAPYHFLTYEHVCHFSEVTLHNLCAQFGFHMMYLNRYIKCNDYPCLCTILRPSAVNAELCKDKESASHMLNYIQKCEEKIAEAVSRFEASQVPLILWGIGASTAQLLSGNFDRCNVIQLVDSNPARQGLSFQVGNRVLQVEDPSQIHSSEAVIFILSTAYKRSIEKNIRSLGYENETASLESRMEKQI